ncbi:MAG TPA: aquaporin [Candidatus Limnocylindria bacterium]|jgi:aquaporin Z|nr:aquaporin [Candidatus Limnocylindria bacterium]
MKRHWPEYLTEAAGLGLFMLSASAFGALLFHPASPLVAAVPSVPGRNALMGIAMAFTALALIYNRWGQQSGAHYNPAVTLTFYRLGKVAPHDALAYVVAQFAGGALGMWVASVVLARWIGHPDVNYVMTLPGRWGMGGAWLAEFSITFLLMAVVLIVSNTPRIARFTGVCAAVCLFLFIRFEAPVSGMSLNPARTLASALVARNWTALWVYFTAPPLGMLAAASAYRLVPGRRSVRCAKLDHAGSRRCIFCEFQAARRGPETTRASSTIPLRQG